MDFAIIETGGKQYKITPNQILEIEKLKSKVGQKIVFDKVLLIKNGQQVKIGKPYLEKVTITGEVLEQKKGPKIRVARFRAKSRYRRVLGHRQLISKVKINQLTTTKASSKKKTVVKKKPSKAKEK